MTTIRASIAVTLFSALLIGAPTALRANGDDFFEALATSGKAEYVVFGNVKDETGRYIEDAIVTIEVSDPRLDYQTLTDVLGHFRTLDIGRAVKDLGYEFDANKVTIEVKLPGYRTVRKFHRGKFGQNEGCGGIEFYDG